MAGAHDVIVVGGSAGSIEALVALVAGLPAGLPAAVFVVIHTVPTRESLLPGILSRRGKLPAVQATDGEAIECGRIYVAPPDCHLLLEPGLIRLSSGPRESGHRPAIDPLFRTAAHAYGDRVVGIILSGTLDDGSVGLRAIRIHGGIAMVQDPREAVYPDMPQNAIEYGHPQHVASVQEIAKLVSSHVGQPEAGGGDRAVSLERGQTANGPRRGIETGSVGAQDAPGVPTGIACPECHGVLWQDDDPESAEFRCRVGHGFSQESLYEAHSSSLEAALWAAFRALQEQASLARHLAGKADRRGDVTSAARFRARSQAASNHADLMERMLLSRSSEAVSG